jgi:hypothetical protein
MNEKTKKIIEMFALPGTNEEDFLKELDKLSDHEQEYVLNVISGLFKTSLTPINNQ